MKVLLFGASGSTGTLVSEKLAGQKQDVIAIARSPHKVKPLKNLTIVKGDVLQPSSFATYMKGIDVVISALGARITEVGTKVYSQGGRNIVDEMRNAQVKKLIVLTSALVDRTDPETQTFFLKHILRRVFSKVYADMELLENLLDEARDIEWICIRPTSLNNRRFTGKYRVNLNHCPAGGWKISRADLADFMVKQMTSNEFIHARPVIAY